MKKWIALCLAFIMALSLCACDGKKDKNAKDDGETVTAAKLTEVVMTETDSDGETNTMKATLEYDEDHNLIASKTYLDDKLSYSVTYDKDMEKPLVELEYDDEGKVNDRTENTYDANGNRVERNSSYTYDGETTTSKLVSTYDGKGNVLTEKSYRNGELEYDYTYTYTDSGKIATESVKWSGGDSSTEVYTYDEHDNVLSITITQCYGDEEEVRLTTYENTYENGKLAEVKCYEDGALFRTEKYDADGNQILYVNYTDDSEYSRTESTYENGKLVKEVDYYDGKEESVSTYTYNADGKLTEQTYTYGDEESQRRVYTYNDNGALVGMKIYRGDEVRMEYTLTYENVTVSKEVAKKLEALVAALGM